MVDHISHIFKFGINVTLEVGPESLFVSHPVYIIDNLHKMSG